MPANLTTRPAPAQSHSSSSQSHCFISSQPHTLVNPFFLPASLLSVNALPTPLFLQQTSVISFTAKPYPHSPSRFPASFNDGGEEEERAEEMNEEILYVKVMTDEQMEVLRRQIAVYATICEQLVEMHRVVSTQQDSFAGMRFGNMYCDPMMVSSSHKIGARQRWTPTPTQLQILENIFEQGNGTPSKQKIKDVTLELTKHGQISETNVYNWFQNRRARSKRKQTSSAPSNTESETEIEIESPNNKKTKAEAIISQEGPPSLRVIDPSFQYEEKNSEVVSLNPDANRLLDYTRTNNLVGKMYYTGMDQLMGKMDCSWEL